MAYQTVTAHEAAQLLNQSDLVVLDMRDPHSFERGHLDGAQLATDAVIGSLARNRRRDPPVLVYCYHGNSSHDLSRFLSGLGLNRVFNLQGGWQAWETLQQDRDIQLSESAKTWAAELGFDPGSSNSRIANGMSMLMVATMQGRADLARELLEAGADPNLVNDDGNTALWFACYNGEPTLLQLLIEHDAYLDHQNTNGATCLIYAASAGKFEVTKVLVDAGADLARTTLDGFNALDSAATLPVLKYLRPHYAAA